MNYSTGTLPTAAKWAGTDGVWHDNVKVIHLNFNDGRTIVECYPGCSCRPGQENPETS